jgi:hypothetical protein
MFVSSVIVGVVLVLMTVLFFEIVLNARPVVANVTERVT